ncbi:Uncharacterized protein FWK35_00027451 [Aphis craccivora]|uniref:Uncharacterized protein n=1 Tax=Aphis craccivora TaxID=307492 RepID=A0A6G0YBH1_APHCR|nr:Uncharacterized protein FWK35_00027451 [Aphis craccivora]
MHQFKTSGVYLWCIIEVKSKKFPILIKNVSKNENVYAKLVFNKIDFFLYSCNSKMNHGHYSKFQPNILSGVIDFTITLRNNASIFNFSSFSSSKVNLVGALRRSFLKFPIVFKSIGKNQKKKKIKEKRNFYAKPVFDQINFFYMVVIQKLITLNFRKFVDKKILDDQKISIFYEICRKRENLQRNDDDLSSNDFKYFISCRYLKILPFLITFEIKILTTIRQNHEYFLIYNIYKRTSIQLYSLFRALKHKPPFSPTIRNDIQG